MGMSPMNATPITIMRAPATLDITDWFETRNVPSKLAVIPNATNTVPNPNTKRPTGTKSRLPPPVEGAVVAGREGDSPGRETSRETWVRPVAVLGA